MLLQRVSEPWPHSPVLPLSSRYQWRTNRPHPDAAFLFSQLSVEPSPLDSHLDKFLTNCRAADKCYRVHFLPTSVTSALTQELFSPQMPPYSWPRNALEPLNTHSSQKHKQTSCLQVYLGDIRWPWTHVLLAHSPLSLAPSQGALKNKSRSPWAG